jgi:hypothetical protein
VLPGVYAYRGAFITNDGAGCWSICYRKDNGPIDEAAWLKMEACEDDEATLPWADMDHRQGLRRLKDATHWWDARLDTESTPT